MYSSIEDGYGGYPHPEPKHMETICGAIRSFVMEGMHA